jgi:hypothetical protein
MQLALPKSLAHPSGANQATSSGTHSFLSPPPRRDPHLFSSVRVEEWGRRQAPPPSSPTPSQGAAGHPKRQEQEAANEESSASNPRRAARRRWEFMDGGDFDLNSQAPLLEEFPGLGLYGPLLQNDDDQVSGSRGPGLPLYRPPRIRAAPMAPLLARQLNFGGSM